MKSLSKSKHYHLLFVALIISLHSFAQKEIRVACIGNSVTFGYRLKDPALTSYPAVLQYLLGEKYSVKNFGHSGATLLKKGHNPYYKTKEFSDALAFKPDIAIIHLGLNDTDPRDWPNYGDEFMADYSWLIDTIRQTNPSVKIFICLMTPIFNEHPRFKSGTRDWFWQIQRQIPLIAKANHTGLIDLHTPLYSRPDLFADALHPNEEGAAIMAKKVFQKLTGNYGGLKLDRVFASHMVLQRDKPIFFYGTANHEENIFVTFNKQKKSATPDSDGKWKIEFAAMKAGGPYDAIISTADTSIFLKDILLGDVWLCSGQSNMAFQLQSAFNSREDIMKAAGNHNIRLFNERPIAETDDYAWDTSVLRRVNELQYFSGTWKTCDSNSAKIFSAVAYYFGLNLNKNLNVPIGLIEVAVGGSPAESWIDRYTMEHDPVLVDELYNWRKSDFFMPWVRERADVNLKKSNNPLQRHPYDPCYGFEAGISHFTSFPIKGVIWYQGESNAHNIDLYEHVFPSVVKSWRGKWGYDFPFYYVQLSSINRPSWTEFRYRELQLLKVIPNSGMAVSSDLGDFNNVHPTHKKEVGNRLADLALHFTYNKKEVVPYGPIPLQALREKNKIVLNFRYAEKGLKTNDGKALRGFSVRDERGFEKEINAIIQKDRVIIPINEKEKIVSVLYGWKPFTDANLVNMEDLPASTFKLNVK